MEKFLKRSLATVLYFVLIFTLFSTINLQANAATVDYVYAEGRFIKNWGIREQVATFLSQNAEEFYNKNNTSFSQLASFSGAAGTNDVTSSELYQQLHNLMKKNHTNITDYGYTRFKFPYTDCQDSGKTSDQISSFYSGTPIGPKWDSGKTWNREHTWPNSKGEGNGENDIMMLRPTAKSENGARGNKSYGKSSGYYNPNMESGDKHDLRGDVARIVLYQHVRWQQSRLFGYSGVIESREVLLEWMQADPVDTWELGRNDSVESITGTRNVFVDYPELAFLLFGEQVPANYQTPSQNAQNGTAPTPQPAPQPTPNPTPQPQPQPAPVGCAHSNVQLIAAEEPRCDIEGYTEGKYCNDCKKYISGREVIEAKGHSYSGDCDKICDNCSAEREVSTDVEHVFGVDNICTICGEQNLNAPTTPEQEVNTNVETPQNNNFAWIIIVAGVVVVAAGVTLVIIYREKIWPKESE